MLPNSRHISRQARSQNPLRGGFALIVALGLMAFVMLLLLSLGTLVQMEAATASQNQNQIAARQNALLGLELALGQLQKLAGPDQRITAPAGIDNSTTEGKQHWTGAWAAGREGGTAPEDFKGWLVSLPDGVTNALDERENDNVDWTADNPNWVELIGSGTVTDGQLADYAAAGKVSVDDEGTYAFWVGEENTKARVNLTVPDNILAEHPDLTAPRHTGFVSLDTAFDSMSPDDASLAKLSSLNDLTSLTASDSLDKQYFHDLSVYGQGVQADAKNGGLKKDLSHLLESDTAFQRYFGVSPTGSPVGNWPEPYAFRATDSNYSFPYGSPNWGILASYYRLHDEVSNGALTVIPPQPNGTGAAIGSVSYYDPREIYQYNQPVHAVTATLGLGVALEFNSTTEPDTSGGTTTTYRPVIHFKPIIALYNPYDVKLNTAKYDYNWEFKPTIRITVGDNPTVAFNMQEVLPESSGYGSSFRWRIENDTNLLPGETRYYSLNQPYEMEGSTSFQDYAQMEADWNEDGAYYVDLTQNDFINAATIEGNTASPYSSNSTKDIPAEQKSARFGFTANEIENLQITLQSGESPSAVNVQVEISYAPVKNGEHYESPMRGYYMRTGPSGNDNQASQLGDSYFQEYEDDMRPEDVDWSANLANLSVGPIVITTIEFSLRTTEDTDESHRQLIDANPRPIMLSGKEEGYRGGNGLSTYSGWTIREYDITPEPSIANLDRFSMYWGNTRDIDVGSAPGADSVVLFHVPREPLISLGSFQHANLGRYSRDPAYIFGSSYAISKIPSNQTETTYTEGSNTRHAYDWSYAINNAVWDSYYFSTLPQPASDALEAVNELSTGSGVLPNPRLSLHAPQGFELENEELATLLTDESASDTAELSAAFLMANGAFNVNSTSVEAWKAFLASNSNLEVPVYSPQTSALSTYEQEQEAIFFRSPISYDSGFSGDEDGQNFWKAYRKLDEGELNDLAQAIVNEVKVRGPFSSLGDFINRRPGSSDPEQRRRGPLQAALDKTVNQPLNQNLIGTTRGNALTIPNFATDVFNDEDAAGTGMPGWVLQGDVLQPLGPLMTVRSDTFRIRAYGDHINPLSNKIEAKAWCEAIVQRIPDPVISTQTPTRSELVDAPTVLGRQFRIVAFRWLNKEDV